MSIEELDIGSAPAYENCAQVGRDGYEERARQECRTLIHQLRRQIGEEPAHCRLHVKSNPHDFGTYFSVSCSYDPNDEAAVEYAFRCERELPKEWDEEAQAELSPPRKGVANEPEL